MMGEKKGGRTNVVMKEDTEMKMDEKIEESGGGRKKGGRTVHD